MDWKTLTALVLGSSVLSALLTQGLSLWREFRARKRDADFAALYVALALEDYACECASMIGDIDTHASSKGAAGASWVNLKPPPEMAGVEWKPLGIKLTNEVLGYRVRVNRIYAMLTDLAEHDTDAAVTATREQAARMGAAALNTADKLRRKRKLAVRDEGPNGWSIEDYLRGELKRLDERETNRAQQAKAPLERARDAPFSSH